MGYVDWGKLVTAGKPGIDDRLDKYGPGQGEVHQELVMRALAAVGRPTPGHLGIARNEFQGEFVDDRRVDQEVIADPPLCAAAELPLAERQVAQTEDVDLRDVGANRFR